MALILAFSFLVTAFVAGAQEAQTTPRAELHGRQSVNSATIIGYRTMGGFYGSPRWSQIDCDDMKVYQTSDNYARCGYAQSSADNQYPTACSDNTVLYVGSQQETCNFPSVTCDTAFVVPTKGATESASMIACWPTSDRVDPSFPLVKNTADLPVTGSALSISSPTDASDSTSQSSLTSSPTPTSTGAAALGITHCNAGFAGLFAGLLALL